MPNVSGQSYAYTAVTPILNGRTEGVIHAAEIRSILARLTASRNDSPFARIPGTHFGRWTVMDSLPQFSIPTEPDVLQAKYLLLVADFDGDRDTWIEHLRTKAGDTVRELYQYCVGFPGVNGATAFQQYFLRCQLETTLPFTVFGDDPLPKVLRALDAQRRFVAFARAAQGTSNAELRSAFAQFAKQLASADTPKPGSI
jgi:hypothetical protein